MPLIDQPNIRSFPAVNAPTLADLLALAGGGIQRAERKDPRVARAREEQLRQQQLASEEQRQQRYFDQGTRLIELGASASQVKTMMQGMAPHMDTNRFNSLVELAKLADQQRKQAEEEAKNKELVEQQGGVIGELISSGNTVGGFRQAEILSGGNRDLMQQLIRSGESKASEFRREDRELVTGKTEFERITTQLDRGTDFQGRPLSRIRKTQLERRARKLTEQETGQSFFTILPDGTIMGSGKAAESALKSQRRAKLEDDLIRDTFLLSDLDETLMLLEEDFTRAGTVGSVKRAVSAVTGTLEDLVSAPTSASINAFASDVLQQIEQDVAGGRTDPEVLGRGHSFFQDEEAIGTLQALEFFVLYPIAEQAKGAGGGRLSNQDLERAEKSFGFTKVGSSERALSSLRKARKRIESKKDVTREQLRRVGGVTISPSNLSVPGAGGLSPEAERFRSQHPELFE